MGFKLEKHELGLKDPMFWAQGGRRVMPRRVQIASREGSERRGLDRLYSLHALRYTAVTNVYRSSRDLKSSHRREGDRAAVAAPSSLVAAAREAQPGLPMRVTRT